MVAAQTGLRTIRFTMTTTDIVCLLIATLGGAAVGLERQWSGHAEGPAARFAGIRTFTMLGAIGGVTGWLWTGGVTAPAAILFAGAVTIVAAGYLAASRHDTDGTTEVAALVVLAAGVIAGIGSVRLASGIIALVTLLLVEKSRVHLLVQRIDESACARVCGSPSWLWSSCRCFLWGPMACSAGFALANSGHLFCSSRSELRGLRSAAPRRSRSWLHRHRAAGGWCPRRTSLSPSRERVGLTC